MTRSFIIVVAGAVTLFGLQLFAEANAQAFVNVPWRLSLVLLAMILALFGGVIFHFLRGSVVVKMLEILLIVVVGNGVAQLVVGSDQAYPNIGLWLIIPYVIVCWFGSALALVIAKWGVRRTGV